ncbi:MAG: NAD(P)/FAD-dependent oxidoreductase [Thermodesulfobacteriota bacterium]
MPHHVIVGSGIAGTTAAEAARKADPSAKITLVSEETLPLYYRIRLPEVIAAEQGPEALLAKKPDWYAKHHIELRLQTRITNADPASKTLTTASGEDIVYDRLLLATGSHSFVPPINGAERQGVFTLRNMDDAVALRQAAATAQNVVVIGGGLLGLEAGNGLRKRGAAVTVVEFFPRLLPRQLDPDGAARLQAMLEDMGFAFRLGSKTTAVTGEEAVQAVRLDNGEDLPADLVLISAGVRPNLDLAKQLGLEINKGVVVDEHLRTSHADVFAAGDVAEFREQLYGIWPAAMEQGRLAGQNLAGTAARYTGSVMANTLKVVGIDLASAGEIDPEGRYESKVFANREQYTKIVLGADQEVIGAILLGNTKPFRKITKTMQAGEKAEALLSELFNDASQP